MCDVCFLLPAERTVCVAALHSKSDKKLRCFEVSPEERKVVVFALNVYQYIMLVRGINKNSCLLFH